MIAKFFQQRINLALTLVLAVLILGTTGFKFLTSASWIDALYMTVITVSTVGFEEVFALDPQTKIFTIFLILISVVAVGYSLSIATEYIVNKGSHELFLRRKALKEIKRMENHIIIVGYGRNGKQAASRLQNQKKAVVVIDRNEDIIERYEDDPVTFLQGNAVEDETLSEAKIENATALLCCLPSDADNLFVVLTARQMNKKLKIISRASEETTVKKLKMAGADNVILPDKIGGDHMASLIANEGLLEFLDNLNLTANDNGVNFEQIDFDVLRPGGVSCTIRDLDLRSHTGCTIIGVKKPDGQYIINPAITASITPGSRIYVLGTSDQINDLHNYFNVD